MSRWFHRPKGRLPAPQKKSWDQYSEFYNSTSRLFVIKESGVGYKQRAGVIESLEFNSNRRRRNIRLLAAVGFNPFTAAACKICGLKDAQTHLQTVYFPVLFSCF